MRKVLNLKYFFNLVATVCLIGFIATGNLVERLDVSQSEVIFRFVLFIILGYIAAYKAGWFKPYIYTTKRTMRAKLKK